jgi:hypothetical protein
MHGCLVVVMCDYETLRLIKMVDVIYKVMLESSLLAWKINGLKLIKWKVKELSCYSFYLNFRQG